MVALIGLGACAIQWLPSTRAPVPQSKIKRCPALVSTSTQDVLPPKWFVPTPGVAIDPRVPQKRNRTVSSSSLLATSVVPHSASFTLPSAVAESTDSAPSTLLTGRSL